jgi:DNA-directed RNA polymerase specialized sigma24 family protein
MFRHALLGLAPGQERKQPVERARARAGSGEEGGQARRFLLLQAQASLLYERYSGKILGYCRRRLSSREEAEDAVQHTFLNAYRSLRTGVVPHAEAARLHKIAENVCHERRRSAWRRSRIELVSDVERRGPAGATGAAAPGRGSAAAARSAVTVSDLPSVPPAPDLPCPP